MEKNIIKILLLVCIGLSSGLDKAYAASSFNQSIIKGDIQDFQINLNQVMSSKDLSSKNITNPELLEHIKLFLCEDESHLDFVREKHPIFKIFSPLENTFDKHKQSEKYFAVITVSNVYFKDEAIKKAAINYLTAILGEGVMKPDLSSYKRSAKKAFNDYLCAQFKESRAS